MKQSETAGISILLILLPTIPAFLHSFYGYLGASIVGFAIVIYLFAQYRPWENSNNAIISLYFTGIFAFGLAMAVFLTLPLKPRAYAGVALVESIPFFVSFYYVARLFLGKFFQKNVVKFANGYVAFLIVVIIGAIIGRFFHNFYELIIIYSGFIALGIIAYFYFKE